MDGYDLLSGHLDLEGDVIGVLGPADIVAGRIDHVLGFRIALGAAVAGLVLTLVWPLRMALPAIVLTGMGGIGWIWFDVRPEIDAVQTSSSRSSTRSATTWC